MLSLNSKSLFMITIVLASFLAVVVSGPIHASCKINWTFGETCEAVQDAIVSQIKKWSGPTGCDNGGEKCLYAVVSQMSAELKATHTTPKKHYVDDLTFDFSGSSNQCMVKASSTSETWYAVLDYGTNYCNLKNLITGAGLDHVSGYSETTSDDVCTQYSSHNCTVY